MGSAQMWCAGAWGFLGKAPVGSVWSEQMWFLLFWWVSWFPWQRPLCPQRPSEGEAWGFLILCPPAVRCVPSCRPQWALTSYCGPCPSQHRSATSRVRRGTALSPQGPPLHLTPSLLAVTCASSSPGHGTLSSHHPSYRHTYLLTRSHTTYNMHQPCHTCTTLSHTCAHVTHLHAHIQPHQVTHHVEHASATSHVYNPLTHMCTHDFPCEHALSHTLCNAGTVEWSNCFLLSITTGPSSSEVLTWCPAKQLRLLSNQTSCLGLRRLLRNSCSAHITGGPRGHPDFQVVLGVKNPPANAET